jgi:hypothetical protein
MICPIMSRPIVYETKEGLYSKTIIHGELFEAQCQKEKCALWVTVTKMPSGKQEERCGLIK